MGIIDESVRRCVRAFVYSAATLTGRVGGEAYLATYRGSNVATYTYIFAYFVVCSLFLSRDR